MFKRVIIAARVLIVSAGGSVRVHAHVGTDAEHELRFRPSA
jgi:hypothetical protein